MLTVTRNSGQSVVLVDSRTNDLIAVVIVFRAKGSNCISVSVGAPSSVRISREELLSPVDDKGVLELVRRLRGKA